ncbi:MAG: efflux RND transporter periplasmic adaptor subunit [Rikenellaceae bacterium]
MKRNIEWIFGLTLGLIALLSLQCSEAKHTKSKQPLPPLTVESAVVKSTPLRDQIWFATSTRPNYSVTIEPRVVGYLGAIHFSGGDRVTTGERLFTIDPAQLQTTLYAAEAAVESAQAEFIEAENNYNRAIPLSEINAISGSTFDSYRATYSAARASLKAAKEQLRSAQLDISYTYINAPIDGVLSESPANLGDYVGPATSFQTLTTISATDTLKVELTIPLAKYLKYTPQGVRPDDSKLLTNITLILPDSTLYSEQAEYAYTKSDAASGSSTVVLVAKIPNHTALLKPNIFARIRAEIGDESEQVTIPQQAVTEMQGVSSVWVIRPDSTASFRPVTLGSKSGTEWVITSGLKSGERVATTGQLKLHQGAKVNLARATKTSNPTK